MFLLTHAYFCLYHALSNMLIRRTLHATAGWHGRARHVAAAAVIFVLAYVTAFMETFTIAQVLTLMTLVFLADHGLLEAQRADEFHVRQLLPLSGGRVHLQYVHGVLRRCSILIMSSRIGRACTRLAACSMPSTSG